MADANSTAVAITSLSQTFVAYTAFLPPLREVRRGSLDDPGIRGDVRLGEAAATALSLGIGFMLGQLTGSSLPLWTTVIVAGIVIGIYELALNGERVAE